MLCHKAHCCLLPESGLPVISFPFLLHPSLLFHLVYVLWVCMCAAWPTLVLWVAGSGSDSLPSLSEATRSIFLRFLPVMCFCFSFFFLKAYINKSQNFSHVHKFPGKMKASSLLWLFILKEGLNSPFLSPSPKAFRPQTLSLSYLI